MSKDVQKYKDIFINLCTTPIWLPLDGGWLQVSGHKSKNNTYKDLS